jgi:cysteine desulfurase
MKEIYYDNSATTKIDPRVLEVMLPFLKENYGNANSMHSQGQVALSAVDEARESISDYLNCEPQEVVFTAGATESNNLAIHGTVDYYTKQTNRVHIITTKIEHPSVLEVFKELAKSPSVEVSYIGVDDFGVVNLEELKSLLKSNTILVSTMYVNNEVGSIQPILAIKEIIKKEKENRAGKGLPLYFHVDAVQAFNYLNCDVEELGVDFLSFSGHKIHGPKGVGGLFIRKGMKLIPRMFGGHHEYNLRPGTLNVAGIVGLGKAVELVAEEQERNIQKIKKIRARLLKELEKFQDIRFNCGGEKQLPNIINVSFKKAEGESILMMLDMEGIAISTGSACSSGSLEPSHVLTAMGVKPEWAHGSMRISLSRDNSEVDVPVFIKVLQATIKRLREMAP